MQNIGQDVETKTINNVPSVAGQQAARPIPADKRQQVEDMGTLENKTKQLIDFAKEHRNSWNPEITRRAYQMAKEMEGFYATSLRASMTEANQASINKQIAEYNPTSLVGQLVKGSQAGLKEIRDSNLMRRDQVLKSLGFNPRQQKTSNQAPGGSGQPTQDKHGREIIWKDGKAFYK
jgi:hypothetical protein